ncbi:MAG: HDOD domain-containing protein [Candidatus Hydrogenedentes bacterium]|nr:HDOD domain-containing protein [Candidatus Hydrogenedentota bacterium]
MIARVGNVQEQLEAIDEVSTLPPIMARIMSVVADETSNAMDLAAEIQLDQALTIRVLRTVNSSYYGFQHRILTVPEAVVLLGFSEIEKLALAITVVNLFGSDRATVKSMQSLWRHSVACSVAAGVFEHHLRARDADLHGAHVAGLLHDVGKAVIAQYFPKVIPSIELLMAEEEMPICDAEREVLGGLTHCEIGAQLAERWNLPLALVESIALHHTPEAAVVHPAMVCVTHLADEVCSSMGLHAGTTRPAPNVNPAARDAVGLDFALVGAIRAQLDRQRGMIGAIAAGAMCA